MKPERAENLRRLLEKTHKEYVKTYEVSKDAIAPALHYRDSRDKEFAAFICAVLAYGKVAHILNSVNKILKPMGSQPVLFLISSRHEDFKKLTKNWAHRFNSADDMLYLLLLLRQAYSTVGSLENLVQPCRDEAANVVLERLVQRLCSLNPMPLKKLPHKKSAFWYLLPRPSSGSACKRLNLFLRWMAGTTEMDLKLWASFSAKNLIIPLDTHVLKQAHALKLTARKTADWKTAEEVTEKLRVLDPNDPTRFDFALCHLGMNGHILKSSEVRL